MYITVTNGSAPRECIFKSFTFMPIFLT